MENSTSDKSLILFKYGGNAMVNKKLEKEVLKNISGLKKDGHEVVIVHGGGPFIKDILAKVKIESEFIGGHRKTTAEAMEYIEMALKGKVNSNLVNSLNSFRLKAVGLSGIDGQSVKAEKRIHKQLVEGKILETDLGQVGDVIKVDASLIKLLLEKDFIPVLSCLAADEKGLRYNINADMFAGHLAGALKAKKFIALTNIDGLLKDIDDPTSIIHELTTREAKELFGSVIQGGMIPKIEACLIALEKGVNSSHIINGTKKDSLLRILLSDKKLGTELKN